MSPQLSVNFNITLTWLWSYILLSCTCLNLCPGLNASTVELVLDIWQGYFTFSHYFIFDRTGCVLVTFYQWEHFATLITRIFNFINVQSWAIWESQDDAVVRSSATPTNMAGFRFRPGAICGLSFLLALVLFRAFFFRFCGFPPSTNRNISKLQFGAQWKPAMADVSSSRL